MSVSSLYGGFLSQFGGPRVMVGSLLKMVNIKDDVGVALF